MLSDRHIRAQSLPCFQTHTTIQLLYAELRSPTEQESTPSITALFQEFFVRLVGAYRESVLPEASGDNAQPAGDDDVIRCPIAVSTTTCV